MRKALVRTACALVVGLLALAAIHFLKGESPAVEAEAEAALSPAQSGFAPSGAAGPLQGEAPLRIVPPAPVVPLPKVQVQPLFEADARLKLEEPAKLRFAARNGGYGLSGATVTASVFHGTDPELHVDVKEVEDGVFEVPFTPHGPGMFNVVLNVDGVPAGSQKVGVVGAAGASDGRTDILDPLAADPVAIRARTPGRGRRR